MVQTLLAAGASSLQNPQPMSSKPSCRMTLVRSENTIGQLRPCGWRHGYREYCVQNKLIAGISMHTGILYMLLLLAVTERLALKSTLSLSLSRERFLEKPLSLSPVWFSRLVFSRSLSFCLGLSLFLALSLPLALSLSLSLSLAKAHSLSPSFQKTRDKESQRETRSYSSGEYLRGRDRERKP